MSFDERYLDELRACVRVSTVVGRKFKLRKQGAELAAVEDPSITVNDKKQLWYDHGSHKEGGDVFKFCQIHLGLTFPQAVEEVGKIAGLGADAGRDRSSNGGAEPSRRHAGEPRRVNGSAEDHAPAARAADSAKSRRRTIVAEYDYQAADGKPSYQVVRFEPKGFAQRRKPRLDDPPEDVKQGWVWNLDGVEHTLYRLPRVLADLAQERGEQLTWFLPEGEKDVHTLEAWDMAATTNSGGAKHFSVALANYLRGADIVIIEDNDDAGRARTRDIAPMLLDHDSRVRVLRVCELWPECPEKGDISDWAVSADGNSDKLYAFVDKLRDWEPEPPPPFAPRYGAKTFADLQGIAKPYDWTIKNLVPRHDNLLIMGPSASGKTFETLDMAMAVIRGQPFCGRKVVQLAGVYLSYEGQHGFENRIRAYVVHNHLVASDLRHFAWWTRPPGLYASEDDVKALAEEIRQVTAAWELPIGFVVIDTHNSATRGSSEIKSDDIGKILNNYDRLRDEVGAPLWIVGHSNKEGRHRGNEQIYNRIDTTLCVERRTEGRGQSERPVMDHSDPRRVIRHVSIDKQRDGADHHGWDFVLEKVQIGTDPDGEPFYSMVTAEPVRAEGDLARDMRDDEQGQRRSSVPPGTWHLHGAEVEFFRALLQALADRGVPPPPELAATLSRTIQLVVAWPEITAVYRRLHPVDDETEEGQKKRLNRIKTAMHRARYELEKRNVIGIGKIERIDGENRREFHYVWPAGRPVVGPGIKWPQVAKIEAPAAADEAAPAAEETFF